MTSETVTVFAFYREEYRIAWGTRDAVERLHKTTLVGTARQVPRSQVSPDGIWKPPPIGAQWNSSD